MQNEIQTTVICKCILDRQIYSAY